MNVPESKTDKLDNDAEKRMSGDKLRARDLISPDEENPYTTVYLTWLIRQVELGLNWLV